MARSVATCWASLPRVPSRPSRRAPLVVLLAALSVALLALLVAAVWPTDRVLLTACQPAEVTYDDLGPYCLSLLETDPATLSLGLGVQRHHTLFIGRGETAGGYGHRVDYSPHPGAEDLEPYLEAAEVDWQPEGLTFREPSGHAVFVPAEQFTGGR